MAKVYPVIHHLDAETTFDQASMTFEAGADGVFLISHDGRNTELLPALDEVRHHTPLNFAVGVNFLGWDNLVALDRAMEVGADMIWFDAPGITGYGMDNDGMRLAGRYLEQGAENLPEVFASVAFKYQVTELDPVQAARNARALGFIPTTSGVATGQPPMLNKIRAMHAPGNPLAVASGMTVENVAEFAPYLSHILVATGVSKDAHHFDYERLKVFIERAHAA